MNSSRHDERRRDEVGEETHAGHQGADDDAIHVGHDDLLELRAISLQEREVRVMEILGEQPHAQGLGPHEAEAEPEPRLEGRERIADDQRPEREQGQRDLEMVVAFELEQRVGTAQITIRLDHAVVHEHGDERHDGRDARHVDETDDRAVREKQIDLQALVLGENRKQHPPMANHGAASLSRCLRLTTSGRKYGLMKK